VAEHGRVVTTPPRRGAGRIVLVVLGVLAALVGLALLVGGGALVWFHQAERDGQGYFNTSTKRLSTDTYAIATDDLDLGNDGPESLLESGRLGRIRIRATSEKPIFVAIGRASLVSGYLFGTSYARVKDVDYDGFRVTYERVAGSRRPRKPLTQDFWVASASGPGTQTVTWGLESGRWSAVLMNVDGSRSVVADVKVGAKIDWLIWVAIGLLVFGVIVLGAAVTMIYFGARSRRTAVVP
jgi:hypothetical protein